MAVQHSDEKFDGNMNASHLEDRDKASSIETENQNGYRVAEDAKGGDLSEMPNGYYRNWRFIGSLAAVSFLAQGLYLGYVLPANVFTIINTEIGPNPNYVLIPIVKTLTGGVGLTLVGRLGDIFGRRWFMIGGCGIAILGSIICATAQNIPTVIGGTVFIGIAGAVQTSFSYVLMELVANKHRPYVTAFLFLTTVPFAVFGPVIARALAAKTALGWRWCYYLNLIDNAIAAILFFICYFPPSYSQLHQGKRLSQQLRELDYGGIFLFSGSLVSLVLGISWGGGLYTWHSWEVIMPIVLGFCVFVGFVFYEIYVPLKYPIVPMALFKSGRYVALVGVAAVATMFYYSLTVIWPQMISSLYQTEPTKIGLMAGTVGGSVSFGQAIGGAAVRFGGSYWQLRISAIVMCTFIGAMAACDASTQTMAIVFTVLGSLALGVVEVIAIIAVPFTVAPDDLGLASGVLGSCRSILGSIALAIFSSVLTTRKMEEIPPRLTALATAERIPASSLPALLKAGLTGALSSLTKIPGITSANVKDFVSAIQQGNVNSYHTVFLASLGFGLSAVICAFFTKGFDEHLDNKVEKRLQGVGKNKGEKGVVKEVV